MNIFNKCPNKTLCKAGIAFGGISLIVSSYFLCKKLLGKKVKKSSPGNEGHSQSEQSNGSSASKKISELGSDNHLDASVTPDVQL